MPLITPQRKVEEQAVTIKLEAPILAAWKHYAEFIGSSQTYVANQALFFFFTQDHEFIQWRLGKYPEARLDDNGGKSHHSQSVRRTPRRRRASASQNTTND